ncbi:MAG: L-serine ammonia-lyase [Betaproteobacteria bacterium]|nr:L-serine ammonia-lyase [Betaproteobacteria bacterium]MDE2151865.1 L-serine ammonia-lyase [Betaproteobacteria bacterium]
MLSVFDLFHIGIGPSSSHTVGPMRAARSFVETLDRQGLLSARIRISCELYGSLGATGKGHGSDKAVMLGLLGEQPATVDVDRIEAMLDTVRSTSTLQLPGGPSIAFDAARDLRFIRRALPFHPNGMRFRACSGGGELLMESVYYSVGGGFIVRAQAGDSAQRVPEIVPDTRELPHPFHSGDELLSLTRSLKLTIAQVVRHNEHAWRGDVQIDAGLLEIWKVMQDCVSRGCMAQGTLPGGMHVRRRAGELSTRLQREASGDALHVLDWVGLFALAVSEENAAGGRVVTAPTNGAAGIIPAVLHYYARFVPRASEAGVIEFLLTAAAIGMLYKENASISGAEVGCQGEVGVACSMAAAGLCAVLGGTPEQVENAAEIAMEHHLGLTCDPVGGLVQIPCIERNAIAAVKAVQAARMALHGDGKHHVSLDKVIKVMRETGADMKAKYKETARGGLAVNIVEC